MKQLIFATALVCSGNILFAQHCTEGCVDNHGLVRVNINHTPVKAFKSGQKSHYIGSNHEHSNFSDGYPGTNPSDYYTSGKTNGYDFVIGTEHSDNFNIPIGLHADCASDKLIDCINLDPASPTDGLMKWSVEKDMATTASDGSFLALRGFEWTSDRFGHINVYFSKNITNAKDDGGYVLMDLFYNWLTTEPTTIPGLDDFLGGIGGGDALGVFNHPGDKKLDETDPGYNWNSFAYVEKVDSVMVGIETFNSGKDYAGDGGRTFYQQALDNGWHVGAIASEDHHGTDWNNANDEKTIIVADDLTEEAFKTAMKNRSFYAVRDHGLRMEYTAGKEPMGSRLQRKTGSLVKLMVEVSSDNVTKLELVSNTGAILGSVEGTLMMFPVIVEESEKWFYIRATDADNRTMAYSSPIWIKGGGTIDDQEGSTAINETVETHSINIFPNPVNGNEALFVESNTAGQTQLIITNAMGRVVFSATRNLNIGKNLLFGKDDVQLTAGVYTLQVGEDVNCLMVK